MTIASVFMTYFNVNWCHLSSFDFIKIISRHLKVLTSFKLQMKLNATEIHQLTSNDSKLLQFLINHVNIMYLLKSRNIFFI